MSPPPANVSEVEVELEFTEADAFPVPGASGVPWDDLFPRLRERSHYAHLEERVELQPTLLSAPLPIPHRVVGQSLAVGVAVERGPMAGEVSERQLTAWQMSFDTALEASLRNLRRLSTQPFERQGPGIFVSPYRDRHERSRLLLTERIRALPFQGAPVAMAPRPDMLMVADSSEPKALVRMAELVWLSGSSPGLSAALELGPTGFRPFVPRQDHPAHAPLRELWMESMVQEHAQQKVVLDAFHRRKERELTCVPFLVQVGASGARVSSCTWTRGMRALLPRADRVCFFDPDRLGTEALVVAEWADVVRIVGPRMVPVVGAYPERWLVTSFPDETELRQLRRRGARA